MIFIYFHRWPVPTAATRDSEAIRRADKIRDDVRIDRDENNECTRFIAPANCRRCVTRDPLEGQSLRDDSWSFNLTSRNRRDFLLRSLPLPFLEFLQLFQWRLIISERMSLKITASRHVRNRWKFQAIHCLILCFSFFSSSTIATIVFNERHCDEILVQSPVQRVTSCLGFDKLPFCKSYLQGRSVVAMNKQSREGKI